MAAANKTKDVSKENFPTGKETLPEPAAATAEEPAVQELDERVPVHLHFRFRREAMLDVGGQCCHDVEEECGENEVGLEDDVGNRQRKSRKREKGKGGGGGVVDLIDLAGQDDGQKRSPKKGESQPITVARGGIRGSKKARSMPPSRSWSATKIGTGTMLCLLHGLLG